MKEHYWYYYDYHNHVCYITQTLKTSEFAERVGIGPEWVSHIYATNPPSLNSGDSYEWIE